MNNDKDLFRQALQRQNERAARMKMPDDMEQRVMGRLTPSPHPEKEPIQKLPHLRRSIGMVVAAAACILLLLMFYIGKNTTDDRHPIAQQSIEQSYPQPMPQPIVEEKKEEVVAEVRPTPQPAKKRRKAVKEQNTSAEPVLAHAEPLLVAESVPEVFKPKEEIPVIPANKQALVDIYLSEEALQVSYKMRAQQETIRAYAASLSGEKTQQPIIAF